MNLYRIVYSFVFVGVASRPSYFNPRKSEPGQHSWWYGFGDDWDTTYDLEKSTSSLATFNYMKKQMDTYGYAQHIGTINRGHFLNPEANSPRDRAFGYGGDFNPRDYSGGAFRYKPLGNKFSQNTYATQVRLYEMDHNNSNLTFVNRPWLTWECLVV